MKKSISHIISKALVAFVFLFTVSAFCKAENLYTIHDLEGRWKFSIGDDPEWAKPGFDDSDWENIGVPGAWEYQGFGNYNGYAWYRKTFKLYYNIDRDWVVLSLGLIDDADEVYLNGHLVGSMGGMQEHPETAYNIQRNYPIPVSLLNTDGENTIAVRVYDFHQLGGIYSGDIGLYYDREYKFIDYDLSGKWKLELLDDLNAVLKAKYPSKTKEVFVPAYWESQGFNGYDGKAQYTKEFNLNGELLNDKLFLVLGHIDDIEKIYINGKKIGSVYDLDRNQNRPLYQIFRVYEIPEGILKMNGKNILTVEVYDRGGPGGIFKGPIGISTQFNAEILMDENREYNSFWEYFYHEWIK